MGKICRRTKVLFVLLFMCVCTCGCETIQDFIRANPAVKDVAVIGLPDARLGEIAAAIVSVKEGMNLTEEELNAFCMGLPRYKRPRKVIFAEVPRNPTGKIEKPKLRKIYGAADLIAKQNGIADIHLKG